MTALRSFVVVAEAGGVTKAAGFLHLTQSAVSMQIKRLEESLGISLLDRSARSVSLTSAGEQFLSYARRMLDLNDEAFRRLMDHDYEGEIVFGVPHDIVYPTIPQVLQRFNAEYPRVKVQLLALYTNKLKEMFARGECDVILTTETRVGPGGETLVTMPLRWVGAPGGVAWRQRPLRLAYCRHCVFRHGDVEKLDAAGVQWEIAVDSDSDRTIEATVSADLAVTTMLEGTEPPHLERVPSGAGLPDLDVQKINLYGGGAGTSDLVEHLKAMLRDGFRAI